MAWRHPKYKHQGFEPVDPDEVNENVRQFTQEDADLNEHNLLAIPGGPHPIGQRIISRDLSKLVQEIAYVPYRLNRDDPSMLAHKYNYSTEFLDVDSGGASRKKVKNNTSWTSIQDRKFAAHDSLLWVFASFQQVAKSYTDGLASFNGMHMVQYALRVNGQLVTESMTDAFDTRDDPKGCNANPGAACFSIDALVPVLAGECTIELVARCAEPADYKDTYVTTRELFCVELRR